MKKKALALSICLLFLAVTVGCGTVERHKGTVIGGAAGAGAGAVIAGVAGGNELVGALLGGLAGAVLGNYIERQESTREATIEKYGSPTGTTLRLEEVTVVPATARPGDRVNLQMRYAVLSNNPPTPVTEEWRINQGNESIGNTSVTQRRDDGTYVTTVPIILPADARPGTYTLQARISADGASDTETARLQIR